MKKFSIILSIVLVIAVAYLIFRKENKNEKI